MTDISTPKNIEKARADIAEIVPYLREAATAALQRAEEGAVIKLAIIAMNPNGSGQVGASFDCEDFIAGLELVFPVSEEAKKEAAAARIVHLFGGVHHG